MGLYYLIVLEFILLLAAYVIFDKDIIAPPVMSILVLLCGTILVIPSIEIWNVSISGITILTIIVGILCCILGGCFAKLLKKRKSFMIQKDCITPVHCHRSVEKTIVVVSFVLTMLYLIDVIRVGSVYGGSGLSAVGYMKNAYLSGTGTVRMNIIIRQGFKIVMVFTYISCFIIANNVLVLREKVRKNLCYILTFLCGFIITIFSGSRTEILRIISALILCFSFFFRNKNGWNVKENRRSFGVIIKKFVPLMLVAVILAFVSRSIVKVKGTGGSEIANVIGYASYYVGSPIQVLNNKLTYFSNTKELLLGTNVEIPEFVYLGSLNYGGNVATIFGSCITYNGLIKMILYLLIVYFVGTFTYYKLYGIPSNFKNNLKIILFSYCYFVFTMAYYSICTIILFEFSNIMIFLLIVIMYRPLFKTVFRFRIK